MPGHIAYRRRFATALAWTPEWPTGVLVAVAWLAVFAFPAAADHHVDRGLAFWTLMCFAMMIPVTLPAIRHVALNSIPIRRHRAMSVYVVGYLAVWVAFGIVAVDMVRLVMAAGVSQRALVVMALAVAAIWQLTRTKRRTVIACRRTVSLPPEGLRADMACMRFGVFQAWRCLVSCWPLMLLMAVVGHEVTLMICATLVAVAEERLSFRDRIIVPCAVAFASAAIFTMLAE